MTGAPPEGDTGLEAFVEAIEATMRARRGKEHVLSPRDFALARGWHEAGVSLATVLVAIDAAFERDPATASLALCRRRVEELAAGTTRAGGALPRETERANLPEVAERLDALRERLEQLPGRAAALPARRALRGQRPRGGRVAAQLGLPPRSGCGGSTSWWPARRSRRCLRRRRPRCGASRRGPPSATAGKSTGARWTRPPSASCARARERRLRLPRVSID